MSYIDWNIAKVTKRGGTNSSGYHISVTYNDGTTDKTKTSSYCVNLLQDCDEEILNATHLTLGASGQNEAFLTTKEIPNVARFKVTQGNAKSISGKDVSAKIIKYTTGISPSGYVKIFAKVKKVADKTWKIVDPELQ